ncbi:MAG: hypothetical protein ACP5E5_06910 [Acidobacteriaceae bacterium]
MSNQAENELPGEAWRPWFQRMAKLEKIDAQLSETKASREHQRMDLEKQKHIYQPMLRKGSSGAGAAAVLFCGRQHAD